MDSGELENFIAAGRIAAKIREDSKRLIMVEEPLLEIAETIESWIIEEGARPAFPVNISLNEIAAHYTPEFEDKRELGETDVVKIDMGVTVEGALSDTAYTVDLGGRHEKLVQSSKEALEAALMHMRAGVTNGSVGAIIENKIREHGYKPISNLCGHMIESNDLHAGVSIPNVKSGDNYALKAGEIYAVEPFATDGAGNVEDLEQVEIFSLVSKGAIRQRQSRQVFNYAEEKFGALPFAERWLRKEFKSKLLLNTALRELLSTQAMRGYPVLRESAGGKVAQFEHTVLIEEKGCRILTK